MKARWAALGTLVVLAVASCSAPAPVPTPAPRTATAHAPVDVNPLGRDRLADGGDFRGALTTMPTTWNFYAAGAADPDTTLALGPLHAPAFLLDGAGRATPNPDVISAVALSHSPATTVTLTLNPKSTWGDGAALTASDWVATWRALNGSDPQFRVAPERAAGWADISDVRAGSGPGEVVLTWRGVEPDWARPLIHGPARAESVATPQVFNDGWRDAPAGWFAGPFTVTHVDRPQGVLTLAPNPRWWGAKPKLERIAFRTIQPEALAAAFQHNEFEFFDIGSSAERAQQARAATDAVVRTAPGTAGRQLVFDTAGVLGDAGVRQGVVRAIDRTALATADLTPLGVAPQVWSNHLLLTNQPGYTDQAKATGLDHDAAGAAEALTRAGWVSDGGVRAKDGRPLTLTFAVAPGDPLSAREFTVLATQLRSLGITLTSVGAGADITPTTVTVGPFPLASVRADGVPGASELLAKLEVETDVVRRADQAGQVSRLLWQHAASLPVYQSPRLIAVKSNLANFGASGFATTRWEDLGWTR